jgi:uncharacterized membrane protein YvbJ
VKYAEGVNGLRPDLDICPSCGRNILRGAMRCPGCGKMLKTPEEQAESIERLRKSKKKINVWGYIKFILFLAAAGVIYFFFSDEIIRIIKHYLNK